MANSQGIKKSNFPASTTVPDAATFDYVYNNTNTKITKANLLAALGVTGTIAQIGNPLSTQVLDVTGTVNGIRSITDGSGVRTSVNALNGIDIAHNFTEDTTGTELIDDISAASPKFASLLPGAGMQISKAGDVITFTATGLPATSLSYNTAGTSVVVASVDTPVIVAGTWVNDYSARFTVNGSGRITYNGLEDLRIPVSMSITCYPVSGSNKDFTIYFAKNGSVVSASGRVGRASSTDKPSVTVLWQVLFSTNDYVEMFLENNTDSTDFTVDHAVIRIN